MSTIANAKVAHNYNCHNGYFLGCLLFSLAQTFQHLFSYPVRLVGIQPKCKGNDHFKIVVCSPTCWSNRVASLSAYRAECSTPVYCFYGGSECRGYHPEQLHQFHFRHPNITAWNIHFTILADSYNCSFHNYIAIEISLND